MGLFRCTKNTNIPLILKIIDLVPCWILTNCIKSYHSDKGCSRYKTYDQCFGQLNKCYTLNDISTGIGVCETFIADLGLFQSPASSTMSDGNKNRDYRIFEMLYHSLLSHYSAVLSKRHRSNIINEIENKSIKLKDSTTISLCLSKFDWAKFR